MDSLSNFTFWELLEISYEVNIEMIKKTWLVILLIIILLIVFYKQKKR